LSPSLFYSSWARAAVALVAVGVLSACAAPPPPAIGANDPFEQTNRSVHAFNRGLDRALVRPASQAYGTVLPGPLQQGVSNFAANLELPGTILNNTLQGDLGAAASNTGRFLVNSTFGLAGILDPYTDLGVPEQSTDFGETLHVWGVGEGSYMELPFLGPSTSRDTLGTVVDLVIDPLGYVLPSPEVNYARASRLASGLGSRYRFSDTVDSVLHESADSYAQTRLIYLQNRRFELGQGSSTTSDETLGDLYDDLYFE